ncbi:MAG: light-harvesting protein [Pseudomonadota bacterium]
MNNAKMWLVVKPTVGIPLFLSAVAVGSFSVHVAVLSNTGWVSDFLSGQELGSTSASLQTNERSVLPAASDADTSRYLMEAAADGMVTVTLPDGRTARLVIDDRVTVASAGAPLLAAE